MTSPYFAKSGVDDLRKPKETAPVSSVKCPDCKSDTKVEKGMRDCVNPTCTWWTIVPVREQPMP